MFKFKPLDEPRQKVLRDGWKEQGIHPVVSHASYLINVGSSDNKKFHGALNILKNELIYAKAFGCQYVVLHTGKHVGSTYEASLKQITKAIEKLEETLAETGVMLLFEVASGQGTEIGRMFEELEELFSLIPKKLHKHLGVCLDTCHMWAAGHDLNDPDAVIKNLDATVGIDRVKVVHVNDSKFERGERKDRHEHLGMGTIGKEILKNFLNHPKIKGLPMILETPIDERGEQKDDMKVLQSFFE